MPKHANDSPTVRAWVATLTDAQRLQYAPVVRRFVRERGEDLTTVLTEQIVAFVEGFSAAMAGKAAAALKHFFGHAADSGAIRVDPTRHLNKALQRSVASRALRSTLARAGFSETELERLSWRDMLPLTLSGPVHSDARLEPELRTELTKALLKQLRSDVRVSDVDSILDQPVVSVIGP